VSGFQGGLEALARGGLGWLAVAPDGGVAAGKLRPSLALLSGAFNPLHEGHKRLAAVAAEALARPVDFELPLVNADKGEIAAAEAARRVAQFSGWATVILTRAARFEEKALLFPGSVFVVGADTALRLLEGRFYERGEVAPALATLKQAGCRFLVACRQRGDDVLTLADIGVPEGFEALFEPLPEARFRLDLSSTALRGGR
jgi:hypothetical protein